MFSSKFIGVVTENKNKKLILTRYLGKIKQSTKTIYLQLGTTNIYTLRVP